MGIGAAIGAAVGGAAKVGGSALIGSAVGTAVGGGVDLFMTSQQDTPDLKVPDLRSEVPETTVEEVEAQEQGWAEIRKRAAGRRSTILTSPQLEKTQPRTGRATLLGG